VRSRKAAVPDSVIQLGREIEEFRSTRTGRAKLPATLWQAAVEQARQHGANVVAHTLRLDYNALKKRMGAVVEPHRDQSPASFVELMGAAGAVADEYVIELAARRQPCGSGDSPSCAPLDSARGCRVWPRLVSRQRNGGGRSGRRRLWVAEPSGHQRHADRGAG
jgi:hypothetical protein